MKSPLKIIVPVFFVAAIGLFVAYQSGVFDSEKTPSKPKETPEKEQAAKPETESATKAEPVKEETVVPEPSKKTDVKEKPKKLHVDTQQLQKVQPVVMPSSKSMIMVQPNRSKGH